LNTNLLHGRRRLYGFPIQPPAEPGLLPVDMARDVPAEQSIEDAPRRAQKPAGREGFIEIEPRDGNLRLHEPLCEQAGVWRERRKITCTKMKLSERPEILQGHHRHTKTAQIFCGRLRYDLALPTRTTSTCRPIMPACGKGRSQTG